MLANSAHLYSMVVNSFVLISLAKVAVAEERAWTDASGNNTITAELVDVQKNKVVLLQSDGKQIIVPLKDLSEADRDFVKSHAPNYATHNSKIVDGTNTQIAQVAQIFYDDLRTDARDIAHKALTAKAQSMTKGPKSPLAALPTPEPGNHAIRIGHPEIDGEVAAVPVQVKASGTVHKTTLHLRHDADSWQVFALSAVYPDGEKSINFEAAPPAAGSRLDALVGKPFALAGTTIAGQPLSASQYRDKVVLVDFWATWCGPCRAEIPNVLANYQEHHNDGFEVISVSVDEDVDALKKFVDDEKPPWTVLVDNFPGNQNSMAAKYQIASIPAFILVGKDGNVAAVNCRGDLLGQKLTEILGKPGAKVGSLDIRITR
jgi:thiol-disulfide isomerase/thioredoxin